MSLLEFCEPDAEEYIFIVHINNKPVALLQQLEYTQIYIQVTTFGVFLGRGLTSLLVEGTSRFHKGNESMPLLSIHQQSIALVYGEIHCREKLEMCR
jgi:hypothetical protein